MIDPNHQIKVGVIDHAFEYPYGDTTTYHRGVEFLRTCETIEDWGCGRGWLRTLVRPEVYRGIDVGVDSIACSNHFADVYANLSEYHSDTPGLFMRHVLEHNFDWRRILRNAISSFRNRMFLAVFTPLLTDSEDDAKVIALHGPPEHPYYDPPVPNLSFRRAAVEAEFAGLKFTYESLLTGTQYGEEHLWRLTKPS